MWAAQKKTWPDPCAPPGLPSANTYAPAHNRTNTNLHRAVPDVIENSDTYKKLTASGKKQVSGCVVCAGVALVYVGVAAGQYVSRVTCVRMFTTLPAFVFPSGLRLRS